MFHYIGGSGLRGRGQVMAALSQVRVSAPMAARARACSGVRRVVSWIWRPLAVRWCRRMRLSSRRARLALRCWEWLVWKTELSDFGALSGLYGLIELRCCALGRGC